MSFDFEDYLDDIDDELSREVRRFSSRRSDEDAGLSEKREAYEEAVRKYRDAKAKMTHVREYIEKGQDLIARISEKRSQVEFLNALEGTASPIERLNDLQEKVRSAVEKATDKYVALKDKSDEAKEKIDHFESLPFFTRLFA